MSPEINREDLAVALYLAWGGDHNFNPTWDDLPKKSRLFWREYADRVKFDIPTLPLKGEREIADAIYKLDMLDFERLSKNNGWSLTGASATKIARTVIEKGVAWDVEKAARELSSRCGDIATMQTYRDNARATIAAGLG